MNIAFLGFGQVGGPLADHLQRAGHEVTLAARDASSDTVKKALVRNAMLKVVAPRDAVGSADVVFLATPFQANEQALVSVKDELAGKVLVDCTNPVSPKLGHGLDNKTSGSEWVQSLVTAAKVVKAFTIYGFENFENSAYSAYNVRPAMLIAGDDQAAKAVVGKLCEQLGWRPVDTGPLSSSLHLEHMTLLWIKMGRVQGKGPNFVWAMLER